MPKYSFDKLSAEKAVAFIETFITHVKGDLAGKPFILEEWQKDEIIKPLFGYKDKKGLRQYRSAYIEIPRKNGKSSLCAAIGLYVLFSDNELGAEIYSAAGDRQQAGIVFSIAKQMVLNNPELSKRGKVFRNSIVYEKKGNTYKAISSDAYTKHGFNSHCIIFDELHTQPNRELWDVLTTSTASRSQPLTIAITTAGYDKNSICWEQHDYAQKVKKGIIKDDTFLPVIYSCKPTDNIFKEETWKLSNPNYGISVKIDYLKQQSLKAKSTPSYENTFRRLHLNQWTTQDVKWISDEAWTKCNINEIDEKSFLDRPCYAGLDLASTQDITALVLIFPDDEGKRVDVIPYFWIPNETILEKNLKENMNYFNWKNKNLIFATEGNVTDYDFIKKHIQDLSKKFLIQQIAYDRWNASQLVVQLLNEGAPMIPYGQGYKSMSAPTKELEKKVLGKEINHGGNEVLRWMINNVAVMEDPTGAIKPAKNKSKEKIDGIVALIMALGIFMGKQNTNISSVYEEKDIKFI